MFVHAVYFWLKDITEEEAVQFKQGLESLATISSVHAGYIGVPAPTDRPIIERSYDYSLVVLFKDQEHHDRYQDDPIHDRFREQCSGFWRQVQIYDSIGNG